MQHALVGGHEDAPAEVDHWTGCPDPVEPARPAHLPRLRTSYCRGPGVTRVVHRLRPRRTAASDRRRMTPQPDWRAVRMSWQSPNAHDRDHQQNAEQHGDPPERRSPHRNAAVANSLMPASNGTAATKDSADRAASGEATMCRTSPSRKSPVTTGSGPPNALARADAISPTVCGSPLAML